MIALRRRYVVRVIAVLGVLLAAMWAASAFYVVDAGLVVGERRLRFRCESGAYLLESEHWTAADVRATGGATRWAEFRRPWPGGAPWTWCLDASWHHAGVRAEILGAPFSPWQPDSLAVAGWWPVLIAGLGVLWLWQGERRSRRRARAGACPSCGYDLAGLTPGSACPECGRH